MYRVTVDPDRTLVRVSASGFFTMEMLEAAAGELHAAIRSLGTRAGSHVSLYDYRGLKVAPQAVVDRFRRYFADEAIRPLWARRAAFVADSALLTMQLHRVQRANMRVFADPASAEAWLFADEPAPLAA